MPETYTFNVHPSSQFSSSNTINATIRRPREITCFSYDNEHQFRLDSSSLRYYYPPLLPADLNKGFDTFHQLDDSKDDHLNGLLEALIAYERSKAAKLESDIVTWRGMMTKIVTVPYSLLDSWEMNATRFQGTIYIEENHAKKLSSRDRQYMAPAVPGAMSQDLMSYWGYKFETISLLPQHWCETDRGEIEDRAELPVSNYAQYCSIVRTGFGKTKLVIGGEVDAVLDTKPEEPGAAVNWVELKTTAEIRDDKDLTKYERKLLKFWAQSFLLGVPKIIVGFRDQQGWLRRLEEMETQQIPDKVMQQGQKMWDGQTCINFASTFLEWLKNTITEDGTWRIQKVEKSPKLEVFKVEESGTGDILSEQFLHWRKNTLPELTNPLQDEAISQVNVNGNAETLHTDGS